MSIVLPIDAIQKATNDTIDASSLYLLSEGFLCSARVVSWNKKQYLIRVAKYNTPWFEYPWDLYRSYQISHAMFVNAEKYNHIHSYWVIDTEHWPIHIMDFVQWNLIKLDEYTEIRVRHIAQKLWKIHTNHYQWANKHIVYTRSLRELLTNHETILSLNEQIDDYQQGQEILSMMREVYQKNIRQHIGRPCVSLHGDFWHNNILFIWNDPFFIDFSRIPYWEPWIDCWWFLANCHIELIRTNNQLYQNIIDWFLDEYIQTTNDDNIVHTLFLSFLGVVYISLHPKIQRFLQRTQKEKDDVFQRITHSAFTEKTQ
jgi:hypothetical protein